MNSHTFVVLFFAILVLLNSIVAHKYHDEEEDDEHDRHTSEREYESEYPKKHKNKHSETHQGPSVAEQTHDSNPDNPINHGHKMMSSATKMGETGAQDAYTFGSGFLSAFKFGSKGEDGSVGEKRKTTSD